MSDNIIQLNEDLIKHDLNGECLLRCAKNPGNLLESEKSPDFLTIMSEGAGSSSIFDDFATSPFLAT